MPKYSIDENFKSDYFNVTSSESGRQNDKDIIRLPNALAVNGRQQKSSDHRISKGSLNRDEWEIFFVLDEDKTNQKSNQEQVTDRPDKNAVNRPEKMMTKKRTQRVRRPKTIKSLR